MKVYTQTAYEMAMKITVTIDERTDHTAEVTGYAKDTAHTYLLGRWSWCDITKTFNKL